MEDTKMACPSGMMPGQTQRTVQPNNTPCKTEIASILGYGPQNALTKNDLVTLTGATERNVRLAIEGERRGGALILSDPIHGYFLAETQEQVDSFVRSMRNRAKEILLTASAVEKAARSTRN